MPANGHPHLEPCPGDDQVIWRFMSVAKFVSLLSSSAIYLSNIYSLRPRDPLEGSYPIPNAIDRARIKTDDEYARLAIGNISEENGYSNLRKMRGKHGGNIDQNHYCHVTYVNCWYMGNRELAFLWSVYASESDGVAIRSTIGRLRHSLTGKHGDSDIVVNPIKYVDYDSYKVPTGSNSNLFHIQYLKRLEFEPEKELRVGMLVYPDDFTGDPDCLPTTKTRAGYSVSCDVEQLVERVVVAPLCASWLTAVVANLAQKYGLGCCVKPSVVSQLPPKFH